MGVRAVIVVADDTGQQRRFWASWASKQYQIPHLARFVHTADNDGIPLSVAGYLAYVATHPGTLPGQDITDEDWYSDPGEVGDLDHRYQLLLCQPQRTFRYLVDDRDRYRDKPGWRRSEDLGCRAQLYQAAARMCQDLASGTQQHMDRNNGVAPPGWPSPQDWRDEGHEFTGWREQTDPQLLHRPGPSPQPVPQWYAVRAARVNARQIGTRLRAQYPGVPIRIRVGADATVNLTVPARLASDADTARISRLVGDLLGQTYTASVRPHRPSRYSVHSGQQEPRTPVNVTLTLRPRDHAAASDPTRNSAEDHTDP